MSVTTEGATRRVTMSQVYVTGLACAMASVRQMSQVWHVMRQMSQVWHVSWRLCVRCHGVRASDVMSRNVKTAAAEFSRKCTPLRKRTNKDNCRCLVTILSSGVARRRLNELIFVKTSNSSKTDIFHFFSL